ncbi:hypothetical protein GCM10009118_34360 [Wandonia haliotis]|uniref:Lipoprotein n=1 Tax=Wandonia haliotis TaxID=574963 RepID=A0ABN1MUI4_9FLAO
MEKIHRVVYLMFVLPLLFGCKQSVNNNFGKKKNEAFFEKIDSIEVKPLLDIDTCIAINDDYYNKFITEISCDEAMEILEQNMDSKRKVYAFYFMIYECKKYNEMYQFIIQNRDSDSSRICIWDSPNSVIERFPIEVMCYTLIGNRNFTDTTKIKSLESIISSLENR